MRYLSVGEIQSTLSRGNSVEQFLGRSPEHARYIRHIELRPNNGSVEIWVYDSEDLGTADQVGLYEYPNMEPEGPAMAIATFEDPESAIGHAASALLAASNRQLNQFVVQDEYLDYIRPGRPGTWPSST